MIPVQPEAQEAMKIIREWPNKSENMSFRYGGLLLLGATAYSSLAINARFRYALKLRNNAYAMSLFGVCAFPTVCTLIVHRYVANKPLLERTAPCPVCIDTHSGIAQNSVAIGYPLVLAPIVNFAFAQTLKTDGIPDFTQPKLLLKKYWDIVSHKSFSRKLVFLSILNFAVGMGLSAWERHDYLNVMTQAAEQGLISPLRRAKPSYDLTPDRY